MSNVFLELFKPFEPDEIEWRVGHSNKDRTSSMALAYVDSRAVMNRLDLTVGPLNWQDSYVLSDKAVVCNLTLKIGGEWVIKGDGSDNTDVEGTKGGISTALKRAAVKFGVGRYLYGLPPIWVPTEASTIGNKTVAILKDEGIKQANKKLDEWVKGYYRLTPILTATQWDKLGQNLSPAVGLTPALVFGVTEINPLAAKNLSELATVWNECNQNLETFKCAYATYLGLPYVGGL